MQVTHETRIASDDKRREAFYHTIFYSMYKVLKGGSKKNGSRFNLDSGVGVFDTYRGVLEYPRNETR